MSLLAKREPHIRGIIDELKVNQIDDSNFSCAAISIANNSITLYINKRKFNALFSEEKLAVLAHEIGHLTLGHLSSRTHSDHDRFIVGLAQDLSLNYGLSTTYKLPEWFVTADKLSLPENLSTSQYIPLLIGLGKRKLAKKVKIPDLNIEFSSAQNKKTIKSIVDKIKVNPHLAIISNNINVCSRDP